MFVQTFSQQASLATPGRGNGLMRLALLLPGFVGVFGMVLLGGSKNGRRRTFLWFLAGLLLLTTSIVGCGGGAPQITPGPQATTPGTYRVHALMSGTVNPPDIYVTIHVQ